MPSFYVSPILDAVVTDMEHIQQDNGYPLSVAYVSRFPVPWDRYPKPMIAISVDGMTRAEADTISNRISLEVISFEADVVIQSASPDEDSFKAMESVFVSLNRVTSATLSLPFVTRVSPISAEAFPVDDETASGLRVVTVTFEVEFCREIDAA